MWREPLAARARSRDFDLLVIGGGIVGASIARDATLRGLRVALVEQGDFAGGTSSKTSKLIHGGLRYLQHGHLRLVAESLRERHTLRTLAPTLVRPRALLLPVYDGDPRRAWQIRLGLWLYDGLAGRRSLGRSRMLSPRHALAMEPALRVDGLRAAGLFTDCQMDDARLCLATLLQAADLGAVCLNYVRVLELLRAGGRLCGATVEDVLGGQAYEIRARVVVNATGPWSDAIRRLSDPAAPARLAPTKGIHLILPPVTREALFIQARDRRMVFVLPWGDYTLVGTTESAVVQPLEALAAGAEEVGYLLHEVNRLLPSARMGEEDVVATFAGARPVLAQAGTSATAASREHRLEVDRWGLISVLGGKYTTARRMAEDAVTTVLERLGRQPERCLTGQLPLLEQPKPVALEDRRSLTSGIDPDILARCLSRYGAGTFHVLELIAREPALAQPVCPHHEVAGAEIIHALEREFACTVTDVLARRTRIAWSACQGLDALSAIRELFERHSGRPAAWVERSITAYRQFLALGCQFRAPGARDRVKAPRPPAPAPRATAT